MTVHDDDFADRIRRQVALELSVRDAIANEAKAGERKGRGILKHPSFYC
jgi:hypothetical protein